MRDKVSASGVSIASGKGVTSLTRGRAAVDGASLVSSPRGAGSWCEMTAEPRSSSAPGEVGVTCARVSAVVAREVVGGESEVAMISGGVVPDGASTAGVSSDAAADATRASARGTESPDTTHEEAGSDPVAAWIVGVGADAMGDAVLALGVAVAARGDAQSRGMAGMYGGSV